jgi:Ca2+-binding EF-hand superfamily protein
VDMNGDGRLSRLEVVECLKAQLPVDGSALDATLADQDHWMWQQWDSDGSGFIERHELLHPQGLAAYVRQAFEKSRRHSDHIPDIAADKEAWYRYWDEDNSGELDKEEVVRALLKTFRMTSDQERVTQMRSTIDAVWPIFDDDGSGACVPTAARQQSHHRAGRPTRVSASLLARTDGTTRCGMAQARSIATSSSGRTRASPTPSSPRSASIGADTWRARLRCWPPTHAVRSAPAVPLVSHTS